MAVRTAAIAPTVQSDIFPIALLKLLCTQSFAFSNDAVSYPSSFCIASAKLVPNMSLISVIKLT